MSTTTSTRSSPHPARAAQGATIPEIHRPITDLGMVEVAIDDDRRPPGSACC